MSYRSSVLSKKKRVLKNAGFSMVELLVSIGIVVLVLSIVVTRQQAFNGSVLLRGQAYEIALAMREIQLGSISSVSDGTGDFSGVQGVFFPPDDNQRYRLFRDANGDNFYNSDEDLGIPGFLDPRFEISNIDPIGVGIDGVAVVFERPNFDASFFTGPNAQVSAEVATIEVRLVGTTGSSCEDIREIVVRSTGQIAVTECN